MGRAIPGQNTLDMVVIIIAILTNCATADLVEEISLMIRRDVGSNNTSNNYSTSSDGDVWRAAVGGTILFGGIFACLVCGGYIGYRRRQQERDQSEDDEAVQVDITSSSECGLQPHRNNDHGASATCHTQLEDRSYVPDETIGDGQESKQDAEDTLRNNMKDDDALDSFNHVETATSTAQPNIEEGSIQGGIAIAETNVGRKESNTDDSD
eukprot:gene2399-5346_t